MVSQETLECKSKIEQESQNSDKLLSGPNQWRPVTYFTVEELYVLEKLECFHSASSIGEEQPQVILRHILSIQMKNTHYTWNSRHVNDIHTPRCEQLSKFFGMR